MIKNKQTRKTIAIFFLLNFLSTLFPYNTLYANNNGPNAPEAAAFEPVDATDMVNLVTGNLSYVLPLLNVPSPEGGYPLALSYHSGIAVDQEASWVGLGWNLNPGAINRGVNGYPDDWGKTNVSEFFYDKGWSENYYSFSAGVTLHGTTSVGLGLSWGSNQSLGGYVSASIGWGKNGANLGGYIGTNGVGVTGGYGGFNGSVGTDGVGVGYGTKGKTSLGVSLNYNYNSGLSGGISITQKHGQYTKGWAKGGTISSGLGINFSSKGLSVNVKAAGYGAGISSSTQSINSGDYDITVSESGFFLPLYIFYVGYNHTNVKYSLFKYNNLYTSGMLYPVLSNETKGANHRLLEDHFMDVNIIQPFKGSSLYSDLVEDAKKNDRNNLVLPNYDNYAVNAQGLSGNIIPYNHVDLILSGRGRGEQNNDNEYVQYLNYDISEYNLPPSTGVENGPGYNAVRKKYFTFSSAYNSFLRLETSDIYKNPYSTSSSILETFKTRNTNKYYNYGSISNNDQRKKEGNTIITYTNKEIRQGNISGFIEAKEGSGVLNRNDVNVFLDDGVGAFQITALDGKTYHYSLPVYQFESVYKNFENVTNEEEYFFEILKNKPYATHWLLTAITGPDYIDTNNDGKVDKGDYGYWVEFDYGKWSDGYIWQTPNGRFEENTNKITNKKTYSYSWGRKQVYYLDAVKTRTHTALFVKDIRKDNKSVEKKITKKYEVKSPNVLYPNDRVYLKVETNNSEEINKARLYFQAPNLNSEGWGNLVEHDPNNSAWTGELWHFGGYKIRKDDYDIPVNKTLALKKIILLKNKDNELNKNLGTDSSLPQKGKLNSYYKIGGRESDNYSYAYLTVGEYAIYGHGISLYYDKPLEKSFNINQHKNILDVKDIEGLGLEAKASQVIEFENDYSLVSGAPNSSSGRLTLKKLHMKGKGGVQLIPPYEFSYGANYSYNKDKIDAWGYNEYNAAAWSLNKITMPTGGNIKINYENDIYGEAAYGEEKAFSNITSITTTGSVSRVNFGTGSPVASDHFIKGLYYRVSYIEEVWEEDRYDEFYLERYDRERRLKVSNVGANWVEFEIGSYPIPPESDACNSGSRQDCIRDHIAYGSTNGVSTSNIGGGIRTKNITINDGVKDIATTEYIYRKGITSYAPSKEQKGIPYVSELPAPTVMYGEVEVQNKDGKGDYLGKTVFDFETLKSRQNVSGYIFSLGENFRVKENQNTTFESGKVIANKYTIESKLGNIGRINGIKKYNSKGQLLSQTKNRYKTELDGDGEIGVTQETHSSYKRVKKYSTEKFYVSSTSKVDYPSVIESVEETSGGLTVTKHFDKHDFLTGQVLETRTYASDGKAFKTKTVPAYTINEYSKMGSKVDDVTNKNMLTQEAANYSYILKDNEWKPVGVGITTWNNIWNYKFNDNSAGRANEIWRKHKTYTWKGAKNQDGTLDFTEAAGSVDFNWGVGSAQTTNWQETSNVTKYNQFSQPIEIKDINGNYAATKMGDNYSKVIATANAGYDEMHYSGAEYLASENSSYFDGGISSQGRTADKAHTGKYSVKATSSVQGYLLTMRNSEYRPGKYKVSVWVDKANYGNIRINDGSLKVFNGEKVFAGEWVLMTHYFDLTTGDKNIYITVSSGTSYIDDFRLHPISSSMMSYVYNEWDEVSYITGANGLSTHYIYDEAGRLEETWVEVLDKVEGDKSGGFKRVSENKYNYKRNNQ